MSILVQRLTQSMLNRRQYNAARALDDMGFDTLPSLLVDGVVDVAEITEWFQQQGLDVATGKLVRVTSFLK